MSKVIVMFSVVIAIAFAGYATKAMDERNAMAKKTQIAVAVYGCQNAHGYAQEIACQSLIESQSYSAATRMVKRARAIVTPCAKGYVLVIGISVICD